MGSRSFSEVILSCDPIENWFGWRPLATSRNRATVIAMILSSVDESRSVGATLPSNARGEKGRTSQATRCESVNEITRLASKGRNFQQPLAPTRVLGNPARYKTAAHGMKSGYILPRRSATRRYELAVDSHGRIAIRGFRAR